jgi:hypothetical protein
LKREQAAGSRKQPSNGPHDPPRRPFGAHVPDAAGRGVEGAEHRAVSRALHFEAPVRRFSE